MASNAQIIDRIKLKFELRQKNLAHNQTIGIFLCRYGKASFN